MELLAKHTYQINKKIELTSAHHQSLMNFYQPLIGSSAVCLYLTLLNDVREAIEKRSHQQLCLLTQQKIDEIEKNRKKCEQFNLIQTYERNEGVSINYIYQLNVPLTMSDFASHDLYGRLLLSIFSRNDIEKMISSMYYDVCSLDNYQHVSQKFDIQKIQSWNEEKEIEFTKIKQQEIVYHHKKYTFNFDELFAITTDTVFPITARTQESLAVIDEYATLTGLPMSQVRRNIGDSIDLKTKTFSKERFIQLMKRSKIDVSDVAPSDKYKESPIKFLQRIQQGVKVVDSDVRLLESLVVDMKLNYEVVNVLIEYTLQQCNNLLPKEFMEKTAASWSRNGVETKEMALLMIKGNTKVTTKKVLPEYYEKMKSGEVENFEPISDDDLQLLEKLKGQVV